MKLLGRKIKKENIIQKEIDFLNKIQVKEQEYYREILHGNAIFSISPDDWVSYSNPNQRTITIVGSGGGGGSGVASFRTGISTMVTPVVNDYIPVQPWPDDNQEHLRIQMEEIQRRLMRTGMEGAWSDEEDNETDEIPF